MKSENCNDIIGLRTLLDELTPKDLETLLAEKRERMRRKEILEKYVIRELPPPDGRFWIRIDGKQYFRKSRAEIENLIVSLNDDKDLTLVSIFDDFIEMRKTEVAPTTYAIDIKFFEMYLKGSKLGNKPISKIKMADGYEYFEHIVNIRGGIRERYWLNIKSSLDMLMKYCIYMGYIERNPMEYLKIHRSKFDAKIDTLDEDMVFSAEEQAKVCELAEKDAEINKNAVPLGIVLLFNTGLRDGELIASKWCDVVDIQGQKHLFIRRIQVGDVDDYGMVRGRVTADRCKTRRSKRKVPLNKKAVEVLDKVREYNQQCGFGTDPNDYIFQRLYNGNVCECTERCFAGRLKKYCSQAEIISKSPHDIRRTALTNLWLKGVPIKVIQMIAGHNTQRQTEEYLKIDEKNILQNNYMERLCT